MDKAELMCWGIITMLIFAIAGSLLFYNVKKIQTKESLIIKCNGDLKCIELITGKPSYTTETKGGF